MNVSTKDLGRVKMANSETPLAALQEKTALITKRICEPGNKLIGVYCLALFEVDRANLPEDMRDNIPPDHDTVHSMDRLFHALPPEGSEEAQYLFHAILEHLFEMAPRHCVQYAKQFILQQMMFGGSNPDTKAAEPTSN